ncbi:RHS repeat-associated core domain-containing protein [Luteibacter yeojuensis]
MAIGLAVAGSADPALAQEVPERFPTFADGALIPAKYAEPGGTKPVYVSDDAVDGYAQVAANEYCKEWAPSGGCSLQSIARRTIPGDKAHSDYTVLDVTTVVQYAGSPDLVKTSSFGIELLRSCPTDAVLVNDNEIYADNRDPSTARLPFACVSPDALPKSEALGVPKENGANQCPIGNSTTVGNPLNPLTMSKIETVVDYAGPTSSGLYFGRTYHSGAFALTDKFGKGSTRYPVGARIGARWRHSWDRAFLRRTYFERGGSAYGTALFLVQEDGSEIRFIKKGDIFIPAEGGRGSVREHPDNGWLYTWPDLTAEHYDDQGRLRTRTDPNGNTVALHYDEIEVGIGLKTKVLVRVSDEQGRELKLGYDRLGRVETVDQPDGGRIRYDYSGDILEGLDADLVKVTYPDGRHATYLYDEPAMGGTVNHKLTGIVGGDGERFATFLYDSKNRAFRSAHGNNTEYTKISFDEDDGEVHVENGDLLRSEVWTPSYVDGRIRLGQRQEKFRDGEVTRSFDYLGGSLVARQTDYLGVPTSYRYDTERRLEIERTEADGTPLARTVKTAWHAIFDKPTRIDSGAQWTSFDYDDKGNLTERRDGGLADAADASSGAWPSERVTRYGYDGDGHLLTVDGPLPGTADTTRHTYHDSDASDCVRAATTCPWRHGDLYTTTNAMGHVTTVLARDGAGRVLSSTDANGVRTDRRYDAQGRPVEIAVRVLPDGSASAGDILTKMTYDANGAIDTITDPDGATITHRYNAAHRLIEQVDAVGNRHVIVRNKIGKIGTESYVRADRTEDTKRSYEYDEHGMMEFDSRADVGSNYYNYDANGRYKGGHGADLYEEAIEHDALGRATEVVVGREASSHTTHLTYDNTDHVKAAVDPKGLSTAYLRNGLGDLLWQRSPDTGDTSIERDVAGRPVKETAADGSHIEREFDGLDRVARATYSDGAESRYTYDTPAASCTVGSTFAVGRLSTVADHDGSTSFCYDFAGRIVQKSQVARGVRLDLIYTYTPAGRLAAITYPGGRKVTYTRDAAGHVTKVDMQQGQTASQRILDNIQHDAPGHVTTWVAGARTIHRWYNTSGFIKDMGDGGDGMNHTLVFEGDHNLQQIGPALSAIIVNSAARVVSAGTMEMTPEYPYGVDHEYGYDKTGNRLSWTSNFTVFRKFGYAADSHHLLIANKVNREYNANGSTTRIGEREFVYDASGRMAQAKVNGVVEMNYAYNPFGQQVARYIAGTTTVSLHDESGRWLGDYDGAGRPIRQIVWLDDLPVAAIDGDAIRDIQPDHLGTPRAIVDRASNKVIWTWSLYGEAFGTSPPVEDPDKDGTKYVFDMRFPGQRYDAVTGLFQNGWRDYDPSSGRYIQSDPIGLAGGISTYAYVGNNPYTKTDVFGLWSFGVEAYLGLGGGFNIAWQAGTLEVTGRIGVGFGGGVAIDPNGSPSAHAKPCGSGYIGRTTAAASLGGGLGPIAAQFAAGGSSENVFDLSPKSHAMDWGTRGYRVPPTAVISLDGTKPQRAAVRAAASIGFEFGSYTNW